MSSSIHRLLIGIVCGVAVLICAPIASADNWLPHPADATWTYEWTDSVYNTTPTRRKVRDGRDHRQVWLFAPHVSAIGGVGTRSSRVSSALLKPRRTHALTA